MAVYNTIPKIAAPLASARNASAAASGTTFARGRAASAAPAPQSQKNEDHAKLIATVQWPNAYAVLLLLPGLVPEACAAVPSRGGAARVAPPQAQVREGRDDAVRGRLRHRGRRRRLRLNID